MKMHKWEPVVMAGLGALAAQLDPFLPIPQLILVCVKGFIGGAVGAYFGNRISDRKRK